eukprot:2559457-Pleurochrysis_carterae.AAC.6
MLVSGVYTGSACQQARTVEIFSTKSSFTQARHKASAKRETEMDAEAEYKRTYSRGRKHEDAEKGR